MPIQSSTLRPGLLVSLKTSISGHVSYRTNVLDEEHVTDAGARQARWETERTISDPEEHEAARKARSKASSLVRGVCTHSAFGLLCPEADGEKLDAAVVEARKIAEEFNAVAKLTRITVYVITGRIAPDDVEAVKAINSEVRDLLADMQDGIRRLDVKTIREAASRAKQMGAMLSPDAEARIQIAVETARKAATNIAKAGEQAAQEVDTSAIRKITDMRTAFLDFEPAKDVAAPKAAASSLDLAPAQPARPIKAAPLAPLDVE